MRRVTYYRNSNNIMKSNCIIRKPLCMIIERHQIKYFLISCFYYFHHYFVLYPRWRKQKYVSYQETNEKKMYNTQGVTFHNNQQILYTAFASGFASPACQWKNNPREHNIGIKGSSCVISGNLSYFFCKISFKDV